LLDAFPGNIARNRRVFVLAADLIDFVYIDDARLSALDVATGVLDQTKDNVFDVFTNISRLGQRRGVHDGERDAQQARQRLRQEGFARPRRSNQQDVRFLQFDVGLLPRQLNPLVVVVYGDRKLLLRFILADDVLIEKTFDLRRLWKVDVFRRRFVILIFIDDVLANANALIADENGGARDQFANVILALVAE
jgi:hypothetical protein